MVRLFKNFSGSFKRRVLTVTALVLAVIAVVSIVIVSHSTSRLRSRQNAMVLLLGNEPVGQSGILGTGINLKGLPGNNLVTNGSFSPSVFQKHYVVYSGSADAFDIRISETRSDAAQTGQHAVGAAVTIYRELFNVMEEIHEAVITGYEPGRIISDDPVGLPEDVRGVRLTDFTEWRGDTYACGEKSTMVRIPSGGDAETLPFDFLSDLTAVASGPGGLMAGDSTGRLFSSQDGLSWRLLPLEMSSAVRTIAYIPVPDEANGFFLASGGPGEVMFGQLQDMSPLKMPFREDAVTSFIVTDDGIVYALGDRGRVFFSMNGINWTEEKELTSDSAWLAGDVSGNLAFFVGASGQMAVRRANGLFEFAQDDGMESLARVLRRITPYNPDPEAPLGRRALADLVGVLSVTPEKIMLLTEYGDTLYSDDQGKTWQVYGPLKDLQVSGMARVTSGDLYFEQTDGVLLRSQLTSRFVFEPALPTGDVQAGDLVIARSIITEWHTDLRNPDLTAREGELRPGEWAISAGAEATLSEDVHAGQKGYDSGGSIKIIFGDEASPGSEPGATGDGAPRGGPATADGRDAETGILRRERLFSLSRQTVFQTPVNNPNRPYLSARLSQRIDLSRLVTGNVLPLLRLEFDVKRSNDADGELEVWFSGPHVSEAKVFTVQPGDWRHQREIVALSKRLNPDDELWINFGFSGSGSYTLDNIWFGRNEDARGTLSSLISENDALPAVDVVRFDAVPIGRAGYLPESWCLPEGMSPNAQGKHFHNLGAVMQFTERLGARPWLVVDMYATADELAHVMEYLAGSPLSPYGRLRSRDGAIGKWSDRFDAIYMEIVDRDNVLQNDAARSNSVRRVIDQLMSAKEFPEIRNRVYFVDGMRYEDGRLHTSADYHAGDFSVVRSFENTAEYTARLEEWINTMPLGRTEDRPFYSEFMRSFEVNAPETPLRLSDVVGAMTGDLGNHTALALTNVDFSLPETLRGRAMNVSALEATRGLVGMDRLVSPTVIRTSESVGEAGTTPEDTTLCDAFRSRGEIVVIASNLGKSTSSISIEGLRLDAEITYDLYDYRGYLVSSGERSSYRDAFMLLPGGVIVIRQSLVPSDAS